MSGFKNEISYSASSAKLLETCARQYYYTRYRSWGGWWNGKRPPESAEAESAYVAKFATSMEAWAGNIVHARAQWALESAIEKRTWSREDLRVKMLTDAAAHITTGLEQAKNQTSGNPKKRLQLIEMNFGLPFDEEELRARVRSRLVALTAEDGAWAGDVNANLFFRAVDNPDRIVLVEETLLVRIAGVKVYVKSDLVMRSASDRSKCVIVDWKTGVPRDSDVDQLLVYEAWANTRRWSGVEMVLVYLSERGAEVKRVRSAPGSAEARVEEFVRSLKVRLVDGNVDRNEPIPDKFEPTSNSATCVRCQFQTICERDGTKPSPSK